VGNGGRECEEKEGASVSFLMQSRIKIEREKKTAHWRVRTHESRKAKKRMEIG